ncbi:MAG: sensor histidine kinase, partial [Gammaproteobacteria bacterium]|nr:sensor histidine kinase [Gammaproteobacteria bacterium]
MSLRPETLRARLIIAVLVPALLIIALSTVFAFRSADRFAQREQDALLLRTAV